MLKIGIANLKFPTGELELDQVTTEDMFAMQEDGSLPGMCAPEAVNNNFREIEDPEENWMRKNSTAISQSVVPLQKSKALQRRSKYSILNVQNQPLRSCSITCKWVHRRWHGNS